MEAASIRSQVHFTDIFFPGTARIPTGTMCPKFVSHCFQKEKCSACNHSILQHTSSAVAETDITIVIEAQQKKFPGNLILPKSFTLTTPPPSSGCLWLGGYEACRPAFLQPRNITVVLNVAKNLEKFYPAWGKEIAKMEISSAITMRRVLWVDDPQQDIPAAELADLCRWIHAALQRANVLVHCAQGKSRSATVVVAYVMVTLNISFEDALLKVVRPARQLAEPNIGFQKKLQAFYSSNEFQTLLTELAGVAP